MSSEVKANKLSPATGTDVTLGDSGDTFTIPSGATITNSGTATGFLSGWSEDGADNDLLPASASAGIYLGVNSATAANLLDDYEEGTWTPTVNGTATYSTQDGVYTKIGNVVHAVFKLVSNGGAGTGQTITGLPFTASPSDEWAGCLRCSVGVTWNGDAPMLNVVGTSIYGVGFNDTTATGAADFTTFGSPDQLGGFVTYTV